MEQDIEVDSELMNRDMLGHIDGTIVVVEEAVVVVEDIQWYEVIFRFLQVKEFGLALMHM